MNSRFFVVVNLISSAFFTSAAFLHKTQDSSFPDNGNEQNFEMENNQFYVWRTLNPFKCCHHCRCNYPREFVLWRSFFIWKTWWASLRLYLCHGFIQPDNRINHIFSLLLTEFLIFIALNFLASISYLCGAYFVRIFFSISLILLK